ncbi:leucyl aminopeptidase, partial [Salipiger sp. HF18]|uniref:leucyl aminopeptidase family protein n=1 Tax=Salipiger sp. HF18 TaxID=2721557 RepID=UPI00142DB417
MTDLREITFAETDLDALKDAEGRVAVFVNGAGQLGRGARRLNRLTRGAVERAVAGEAFAKASQGDVVTLAFPVGMAADAVDIIKLERRGDVAEARKAGAIVARLAGSSAVPVLGETLPRLPELVLGLALRGYGFTARRSDKGKPLAPARILCGKPHETEAACKAALAVAEGVFFTRDLVNEPANVLTTTEFATRLEGLRDLGVEVEVLEEDKLAELGMGALLCVGQGSVSPSKVVSGVMKALALRRAPAHVVGLVGLVENMPSGSAVRPGDVVTSMKGDTIEVINTDAEGRLVLADVLWYAQEHVKPAAMVDLATLTGACIIALGHENAAVLSNDDGLA